ncbi:CBS domain-containing protein [Aerosakkonema funiforme]|uniref:CBS domain-containing protein n=2 Tax=Oscillatoriophycideae TaxID=1301283 RepID=A0A926VB25_9CYAN|nr:CBS domain-containing protein [Aerosakkonema funiforme]MBD2180542.1 CBS domain-containing protein [Aerosakkonema funiforme FACHB-1375]
MKAKDIMTQDVATVRGSATVAEAVRLMRLKEVRALIVEARDSEDAYGIVTETDVVAKVVAYGKDPKDVRVYEIMSKPCIVVNPDLNLEYVARLFANTGVWRAPVIQGDLLGIISVTDILNKGDFLENPKLAYLEQKLQQAISNARSAAANFGNDSKEATEAWDLVDEIEAEAGFYGLPKPEKTARELFFERPMQTVAVS